MLTDSELLEAHRELAEWVEDALSQIDANAPEDALYDAVYAKLSEISSERAERQSEDRGSTGRGGPY